MNDTQVKFLKTDDVAKMLNLSTPTVRKLSETGKLKGYRFGNQWRFKADDVDNFIQSSTVATKVE